MSLMNHLFSCCIQMSSEDVVFTFSGQVLDYYIHVTPFTTGSEAW